MENMMFTEEEKKKVFFNISSYPRTIPDTPEGRKELFCNLATGLNDVFGCCFLIDEKAEYIEVYKEGKLIDCQSIRLDSMRAIIGDMFRLFKRLEERNEK